MEKKEFHIALLAPSSKEIPRATMENLALGYLSAGLKKNGYSVDVIDSGLHFYSQEEVIERVILKDTKLLAISLASVCFKEEAKSIIQLVRSKLKTCHITVGGYYPTSCPEAIKELGCDSILYGEGDLSIVELANRLVNGLDWKKTKSLEYIEEANNIVINESVDRIVNLDELPFPGRENLKFVLEEGNVVAISSSRGCYGSCSFCLIQSNFAKQSGAKKWTARSAKNVVDEIEMLIRDYQITEVWFVDPNFMGPPGKGEQRAIELAEELVRRGCKITFSIECRVDDIIHHQALIQKLFEAGLRRIFIGIESGVQRALDFYHKGVTVEQNIAALAILKQFELSVHIGFIFYDPESTLQEIRQNIIFLREHCEELSISNLGCNWLGILNGTPIFEKMKKLGIHPDALGFGYKLPEEVRRIYVLTVKYISQNQAFYQAERISWRDQYRMRQDEEGIVLTTQIRKVNNSILLDFMEELVDFMLEKESYEVDDLIHCYWDCVTKLREKVQRLQALIIEEKNYQDQKSYQLVEEVMM